MARMQHSGRRSLASLVTLLALPRPGRAQSFPDRPITIVVPFTPGGGPDLAARLLASTVIARSGWRIVVDDRPGAGGTIGMMAVARAAPDGYTLLMGSTGSTVVAPALYGEARVPDPVKALAPVIQVASGPFILSVRADLPANSVAELVALARARPGVLNYGTAGVGSLHHLGMEQFLHATGCEMTHVPFRGAPLAWTALASGEIQVVFDSMPGPLASLQAGRARAIAVTGANRLGVLPAVPSFREQGVTGADVTFFYGILAPAGTPAPILAQLNQVLGEAIRAPEVVRSFGDQSIDVAPNSVAEFTTFVAAEAARWKAVVQRLGIKAE